MFKHIKLTSISWLLALLLAVICGSLAVTQLFLSRNIEVIDTTWHIYQTDLSEKARLEGSLRAAIGYGGMIHNYKNYLLRQDYSYNIRVHDNLGAARAVLQQLHATELNNAEALALIDISAMLDSYDEQIHVAEALIAKQRPIAEIELAARVDDRAALRGLQTLRKSVINDDNSAAQLSKARMLADIRAAIGYGGFIHDFKNFLLRHDIELHNRADLRLHEAEQVIERYRQQPITRAEEVALEDVADTLAEYDIKLHRIVEMLDRGMSIGDVDREVKVDDGPAVRALHTLEHEIAIQIAQRSANVSKALDTLKQLLAVGTWGMILLLLLIALFTYWLMQARVIKPILRLTHSMSRLAKNNLDVEISGHYRENELGQMAEAVRVFKKNMLQRQQAEEKLASANTEMNQQLRNIEQLRQQSEAQTNKALALAEGLASARESAEWAMAHAKEEEEKVSAILNSVRDAIITSDAEGTIETFNPGAEDIFGYRAHEVIGKSISILMPEEMHQSHAAIMQRFVKGVHSRAVNTTAEQVAVRSNGDTFPVEINIGTTHMADELKIIAVMRDITERKQAEDEIRRMALTDPLTGLANRNQFNARLKESIAQANRYKQNMVLMLVDLDKFKPVNDTYGHPVGDALLQHVADTMRHCFREVDIVARLGGDEFAVILNGIENTELVVVPAQRLIDMVAEPVVIEGHTITIGCSIGLSSYPSCSTDIDELFRQADAALYRAKESGRNNYQTCKTFAAD